MLRYECSQFKIGEDAELSEIKQKISTFIYEFFAGVAPPHYAPKRDDLIIDAALKRLRIPWQHRRPTNRVTQQLSDQSNDTQRPSRSSEPLRKSGPSYGRSLRIVSCYNIPDIIIAIAVNKAISARDGWREIH